MQWYKKSQYQERLVRETDYIKRHNETFPQNPITLVILGERLFAWYKKDFNCKPFVIFCEYPEYYPQIRITVHIFEDRGNTIEYFRKGYHNSTGRLCLYAHYPNQWIDEYGIEDIIKRVNEWFLTGRYDPINAIPLDYNIDNDLFIYSGQLLKEKSNKKYSTFEYVSTRNICVITAVDNKNCDLKEIPTYYRVNNDERKKGIIIYTDLGCIQKYPTSFEDIKSRLYCFKKGVKGFFEYAKTNNINFPIPLIIIYKDNIQVFYVKEKDGLSIDACRIQRLNVYKDIFSREKAKDDLDYLKQIKVGIVGLGAIGSVIAIELARSGVGKFLLIDKDKLDVSNIGRHDLTLSSINKFKVNAIEEKIALINPLAKCKCYPHNVIEDSSILLSELSKCSLIVSSIDDQEAKLALNAALIPLGKKIVFAGAFYDSVAGYVLVSDKKIACFECISANLDLLAEKESIPDFSGLVPENIDYSCGTPVFPGGSINTHSVSLFASRIAIDVLLGKEMRAGEHPYNLYLIGNTQLSIKDKIFFEGFMDVKKYVIPGIQGCTICDCIEIEDPDPVYLEIIGSLVK